MALHWEDIAYVADISDTSLLIAWGRIPFARRIPHPMGGDIVSPVDQSDLPAPYKRQGFIGAASPRFGKMRVELHAAGREPFGGSTSAMNCLRIDRLTPNTTYEIRLFLRPDLGNGALGAERPFAAGIRTAAARDDGTIHLHAPAPITRTITTHPSPTEPTPTFRFFVVGDQGTCIHGAENGTAKRLQAAVAARMNEVAERPDAPPLRMILGTGDNIYATKGSMVANLALWPVRKLIGKTWLDVTRDSGDEDDEWYFAFFAPYQKLLASVPFYPSAGNHDGQQTECGDDRRQLADNLYLVQRFGSRGLHPGPSPWHCETVESIGADGLFYRVRFGKDFELRALDTSTDAPIRGRPYMDRPGGRAFLDSLDGAARWVVPFGHHAPFGAGPVHTSGKSDVTRSRDHLWQARRLRSTSVRAAFFGHEHNFQHFTKQGGGHVFITGASGKANVDEPDLDDVWAKGQDGVWLTSWGLGGHFLECTYENDTLTVQTHGVRLLNDRPGTWSPRMGAENPIVITA